MKTCSHCGLTKEDGDFYTLKTGCLYSWCKKCSISDARKRNAAAYIKRRSNPNQYNGKAGGSILNFRDNDLKNKQVCTIIREHHERLKDDPERLRTNFIQKLVDVNCKKGVTK